MLKEGTKAPAFTGEITGGGRTSLKDYPGRWLLLYFYPKDSTPGCTKEACGLRDQFEELTRLGISVLGVSADSLARHERFSGKYRLPFPLLADEEKTVIEAYQAWGSKKFMGRTFEGILRISYLIGPDGRIKKAWPKVNAARHAEEVLEALRELLA